MPLVPFYTLCKLNDLFESIAFLLRKLKTSSYAKNNFNNFITLCLILFLTLYLLSLSSFLILYGLSLLSEACLVYIYIYIYIYIYEIKIPILLCNKMTYGHMDCLGAVL